MGSAFEQLLGGPSSSYGLGKKFGQLFQEYGSVTVAEGRDARPGIEIDTSKPEYAEAQPKWWIHRKWLEELYDVRSKATHKGHHKDRPWGWSLTEHLLMAAFVFPLTVKVLLARGGHYILTEEDQDHLDCVDRLLAAGGWDDEVEEGGSSRWQSIVSEVKLARQHERLMAKFMVEHPEWWND